MARTSHDPFCPALRPQLVNPNDCTFCEVIDAVRADEQSRR